MKDLKAPALCIIFVYKGYVGTGTFTRQRSYSCCSVHLRLINATCVKYSDLVLPHVSTPVNLTSSHLRKSSGPSSEVVKAWEQGYSAIVYELDAEQIKLCTHIWLPGTQ